MRYYRVIPKCAGITTEIYDRKLNEWKNRQHEIDSLLRSHTEADESYHITAAMVFNVAKRSLEIVEKAEPMEQRAFFNYLLQNCTVDDKKLTFELRTPYNHIFALTQTSELVKSASNKAQTDTFRVGLRPYLPGQDSNLQPSR